MLFNSYIFLFAFLPLTWCGSVLCRGGPACAVVWLLAASIVFYGWWEPGYLPLLIGSILVNYALGRILERLAAYHFNDVAYSEQRLAVLAELRTQMEERGIRYVVFINPLSRPVLELIERLPAQRDFLRFRRDLPAIFPEVVVLSDGAWSDPALYFRFDPYHYPAGGRRGVRQPQGPAAARGGPGRGR